MDTTAVTKKEFTESPELVETSEAKPRFYCPELDMLRFFAFFAVFLHHLVPASISFYSGRGISTGVANWLAALVGAGQFGVDLFFVLSSYLITEILFREYEKRSTIDIKAFYIRRALRIWPLYFFFLLVAIFLVPVYLPNERVNYPYTVCFALFVGNWSIAALGLPLSGVIVPLWSVSVEEQFYLGWPLLMKVFGVKAILKLGMLFIIASSITRLALVMTGRGGFTTLFFVTLTRLEPIACGAVICVLARKHPVQLSRLSPLLCFSAGIAGLVLIERFLGVTGYPSLLAYPFAAIACSLLLISFLNLRLGPSFLGSRLISLGRISYGLYVFHMLFIRAVYVPHASLVQFAVRSVLCFALTVSVAALSYRFLERPFLRLKESFSYVPSRPS